jgi:hypothetical protein
MGSVMFVMELEHYILEMAPLPPWLMQTYSLKFCRKGKKAGATDNFYWARKLLKDRKYYE